MTPPLPADTNSLEKIFHEPNRLAIMSAVCAAPDGISFRDLKTTCSLTDGNLSRHLKVLEESRVIRAEKRFVDAMPRTTIHLSKTGLARFHDYLATLSQFLKAAQRALPASSNPRRKISSGAINPNT